MILKSSPSKFGKGTSLLWNGNNFNIVNSFIYKLIFKSKSKKNSLPFKQYFFESARSAIYNILVSQNIGIDDQVIVCSFTCDAVSYAVFKAGAKIIYVDINDDLSMNDDDVLSAINPSTKAIIMQNSFGRFGLRLETINKIKDLGILLIEDCALSWGSKYNEYSHGELGDFSIWSLEVSKTITIGWGGIAKINNIDKIDSFESRYQQLGGITLISDIRRIFQLWFSLLMTKVKIPGAIFMWYGLYGLKIFRVSNNYKNTNTEKKQKMGKISSLLYLYLIPYLEDIFDLTNKNYLNLLSVAKKSGINLLHDDIEGEYIVSPRFPLLIEKCFFDQVYEKAQNLDLEIGRWFDQVPPSLEIGEVLVFSCDNAKRISGSIINLPCHWNLKEKEMEKIKALLIFIASIHKGKQRGFEV
jgi:perosamine synthetase